MKTLKQAEQAKQAEAERQAYAAELLEKAKTEKVPAVLLDWAKAVRR